MIAKHTWYAECAERNLRSKNERKGYKNPYFSYVIKLCYFSLSLNLIINVHFNIWLSHRIASHPKHFFRCRWQNSAINQHFGFCTRVFAEFLTKIKFVEIISKFKCKKKRIFVKTHKSTNFAFLFDTVNHGTRMKCARLSF